MSDQVNYGKLLGPTLRPELIAAGVSLEDMEGFGFDTTGVVTYEDGFSALVRADIEAVIAVHNANGDPDVEAFVSASGLNPDTQTVSILPNSSPNVLPNAGKALLNFDLGGGTLVRDRLLGPYGIALGNLLDDSITSDYRNGTDAFNPGTVTHAWNDFISDPIYGLLGASAFHITSAETAAIEAEAADLGIQLFIYSGVQTTILRQYGLFRTLHGSPTAIGTGLTRYFPINGTDTFKLTDAAAAQYALFNGAVYMPGLLTTSSQPASGNLVVTLMKNGVATALQIEVGAGGSAGFWVLNVASAISIAVTPSDTLSYRLVNNALTDSAIVAAASMKFVDTDTYGVA